ncbi:epoxide hydrolase [Aeromicrobium sp. Root236]|uniref:epoxide hydrolase family protein n=1 Tax=Aeromicrobium sp. Root236 TaxID=1736498 RepID=UPI0006F49673|nr:epoxide hydrolase family protein [Aeromicrobium sp. Root236]KRC66885.1 epoxide hydrolase [Aeromicrobium sp. Root236]
MATLRSFTIDVPDAELEDLRRRLADTRWPDPEPVGDWSQGVPLDFVRDLTAHWLERYDWRETERRLNTRAQLVASVQDVDIHLLHVESRHPEAIPLVMTHGWPGSVVEFEALIDPLVDPTSHGGAATDAFHVVLPSLPGYGFSGKPAEPGWGIDRIADAWAEIMAALGYERFAAQGSDWGTSVTTRLAQRATDRVIGIHVVPPLVPPDPETFDDLTDAEASVIDEMNGGEWEEGYAVQHSTKPQTLGYGLVDSPVGLLAWIAEKIVDWTDHEGDVYSVLSKDQILDNVMFYWLNRAGASSARLYWESFKEVRRWFTSSDDDWFASGAGDRVAVPTAASIFPGEAPRPSRRWAEKRFVNITHWNEPARGGHFAAWERPELMIREIRAAFADRRKDNP